MYDLSQPNDKPGKAMTPAIATLDLSVLRAANLAASNEETRYYLQGVCVELTATSTTYVATDGHILFAYHNDSADNTLIGTWIIPSSIIKQIKPNKHNPYVTLSRVDDKHLKLENGIALVFEPIDGTFPAWRHVIPQNASDQDHKPKNGEGYGYDPTLLAKLWKAGDLIGSSKPTLTPNGNSPALVHYSDNNAFAVIMPITCGSTASTNTPPAWVRPQQQSKAA
jgi:DNA polymerase-3 subunit beta